MDDFFVNQLLRKSKPEIARLLMEYAGNKEGLRRACPRIFKRDAMRVSEQAAQSASEEGSKLISEIALLQIPCQPVLLRVAYLGHDLSGLQSNAGTPLTVERVLCDAVFEANMSPFWPMRCILCGRTDAGVSALGQVVQMWLRAPGPTGAFFGALDGFSAPRAGIDYCGALNPKLPREVRVRGFALVQPGFSARFSCQWRQYAYAIHGGRDVLDIELMRRAASDLVGEHDFRNFCREERENYVRRVIFADIALEADSVVLTIRGSGFLYHQVRCIVSVLALVGAGLEPPSVVADLLDVQKHQTRPLYDLAPAEFLVFQDAGFEGVEWTENTRFKRADAAETAAAFTAASWCAQITPKACPVLDACRGSRKVYRPLLSCDDGVKRPQSD